MSDISSIIYDAVLNLLVSDKDVDLHDYEYFVFGDDICSVKGCILLNKNRHSNKGWKQSKENKLNKLLSKKDVYVIAQGSINENLLETLGVNKND